MMVDARINAALPDHPKTKKLIRRLGQGAAWNLTRLFLWAAANRPDGRLSGMSDEDIEIAVDWLGEPGVFVVACADVRFLDGGEGNRSIHDWAEHNPWAAGSVKRSEKAKWAALCKQHGRPEAAQMMPEYAERLRVAAESELVAVPKREKELPVAVPESATSTHVAVPDSASSMPLAQFSSAPSPSPSPSPSPNTPLPPKGGGASRRKAEQQAEEPPGFVRFWTAWPKSERKQARGKCCEMWRSKNCERAVGDILTHVERKKRSNDWTKDGGAFIEAPLVYLRNQRWDGAEPAPQFVATAAAGPRPAWEGAR